MNVCGIVTTFDNGLLKENCKEKNQINHKIRLNITEQNRCFFNHLFNFKT